jgi:cephalosporin hydroxylase
MNQIKQHKELVVSNITNLGKNIDAQSLSRVWSRETNRNGYTYNFSWQGRPIIQYPQDMVAMQELIWQIKPDLIIETGIAHGGSLIFSASQLAQLDICDAIEAGTMLDPKNSKRKVWGPGNNPKTAVWEYLKSHPEFEIDKQIDHKLLISVAPDGYLRRVR